MVARRVILAPGASAGPEQLARHASGLEARGFAVDLITLPRGPAERAVPAFEAAVGPDPERTVIGGQSFGGRVASMLAIEAAPAALVLFSYPLHAPGRHERWAERTADWPRIACPVLLLSGEADPFARLDLLQGAVQRLPHATLVTYPGVGHGLGGVLDAALDEVAAFLHANT